MILKKALVGLLVCCMMFCLLPAGAEAQEKTQTPELGRTKVVYTLQNESGRLELTIRLSKGSFDVYPAEATVQVYDGQGNVPAAGTGVSVIRDADANSSALVSIYGPVDTETTYYITVQEPEKEESEKVPFTVLPYSEEGAAYEWIQYNNFSCPQQDAADAAMAKTTFLSTLNGWMENMGSSYRFSEEGITVIGFTPAAHGVNGRLSAKVLLLEEWMATGMTIEAEEYEGNAHYVPENAVLKIERYAPEGQVVESQGFGSVDLLPTALAPEGFPDMEAFEQAFLLSSSEKEAVEEPRAAIAGIHSVFGSRISYRVEISAKGEGWQSGEQVYLWYTPEGSGQGQCLGAIPVTVETYDQRTPTPRLLLPYSDQQGLLILENPEEIQGATYRLYQYSGFSFEGERERITSYEKKNRFSDVIEEYSTVPKTSGIGYNAITAVQEGKYESEPARYISYDDDGIPEKHLTEYPRSIGIPEESNVNQPVPLMALAELNVIGFETVRISVAELDSDAVIAHAQYGALQDMISDGMIGAYESTLHRASLKNGKISYRIQVGSDAHTEAQCIQALWCGDDGKAKAAKAQVDSKGFLWVEADVPGLLLLSKPMAHTYGEQGPACGCGMLVKGDINGDLAISLTDAVYAARLSLHAPVERYHETYSRQAADVNGDNTVDLNDVLLLCKYLAGNMDADTGVLGQTYNGR